MMRVGWLFDKPTVPGGAEMTQAEFRAAAPDDVEVIDCRPGEPAKACDVYVIHNCMQYSLLDFATLAPNAPIVRYWHDVGPWLDEQVYGWLRDNATHVCCSPIQAELMDRGEGRANVPSRGLDATCIPPPVDLARFERAAARSNGSRSGVVSVGSWRNHGKAPHKVAEWAGGNVDFFGDGPFAPAGTPQVPYADMPDLLASYETFVYLPTVLEPFGRTVAEAWAAGCEVVTNRLVGAAYWVENAPSRIYTAGEDFWNLVQDTAS